MLLDNTFGRKTKRSKENGIPCKRQRNVPNNTYGENNETEKKYNEKGARAKER
jgi:hypothetical protein